MKDAIRSNAAILRTRLAKIKSKQDEIGLRGGQAGLALPVSPIDPETWAIAREMKREAEAEGVETPVLDRFIKDPEDPELAELVAELSELFIHAE